MERGEPHALVELRQSVHLCSESELLHPLNRVVQGHERHVRVKVKTKHQKVQES